MSLYLIKVLLLSQSGFFRIENTERAIVQIISTRSRLLVLFNNAFLFEASYLSLSVVTLGLEVEASVIVVEILASFLD